MKKINVFIYSIIIAIFCMLQGCQNLEIPEYRLYNPEKEFKEATIYADQITTTSARLVVGKASIFSNSYYSFSSGDKPFGYREVPTNSNSYSSNDYSEVYATSCIEKDGEYYCVITGLKPDTEYEFYYNGYARANVDNYNTVTLYIGGSDKTKRFRTNPAETVDNKENPDTPPGNPEDGCVAKVTDLTAYSATIVIGPAYELHKSFKLLYREKGLYSTHKYIYGSSASVTGKGNEKYFTFKVTGLQPSSTYDFYCTSEYSIYYNASTKIYDTPEFWSYSPSCPCAYDMDGKAIYTGGPDTKQTFTTKDN